MNTENKLCISREHRGRLRSVHVSPRMSRGYTETFNPEDSYLAFNLLRPLPKKRKAPPIIRVKIKGVPQGGSISPFVSLLILEEYLIKPIKEMGHGIVMYADDGLVFSEEEINLDDLPLKAGITFKPEKCRHIKRKGE